MNNFPKNGWFIVVAGGLAAGVVTGILIAPEDGKSLRNRLSYQAGKTLKNFDAFLGEQYRRLSSDYDEQVKQHPVFSKEDEQKMNSLMEDADKMLRNIKSRSN